MTNNNIIENMMESIRIDYELNKVIDNMEKLMHKNELYMAYLYVTYDDKLRTIELIKDVREKMDNLKILIDIINELEAKAIQIKELDTMWRCESNKAKLINQMEELRSKFDL